MHWMFGDGMGWMMLWWVLWIVIIAVLVWSVAKAAAGRTPADDPPETILKRRYARGEMNREEYAQRLTDLRR